MMHQDIQEPMAKDSWVALQHHDKVLSCLVYPPRSGEERGLLSRTAAGQ